MVNIESDQAVSMVDPFSAANNNNNNNINSNNNNNNTSGLVGDATAGSPVNNASPTAGSASYSFQGKPRSLQKTRLSQNEENRY